MDMGSQTLCACECSCMCWLVDGVCVCVYAGESVCFDSLSVCLSLTALMKP